MDVAICKSFKFDAAHYLPEYDGDCSRMHGHSWTGEFELTGRLDPDTGMVVDFRVLKEFLKEQVEEIFDHSTLNIIVSNPTAENLCVFILGIWRKYALHLSLGSLSCRIRIYESPGSFAELKQGRAG